MKVYILGLLFSLFSLSLFSQGLFCDGVAHLLDFEFGMSKYSTTKSLLLDNPPFVQDKNSLDYASKSSSFQESLARFNLTNEQLDNPTYAKFHLDTVSISRLFFEFPNECFSGLDSQLEFVFADDTLYSIEIEFRIPVEELNYGVAVFDELKKILSQRYSYESVYMLKSFESDVVGGEAVEFYNDDSDVSVDRNYARIELRNIQKYHIDAQGTYTPSDLIDFYRIELDLVNYRYTRLNGRGQYR